MTFIVFEGIDGCGKTTQARKLYNYLKEKGYNIVLMDEPTNGIIGGIIREYLKGRLKLPKEAIPLLYAADRIVHTRFEIEPALREGKIVICDRYFLSNVAYQEFPIDWILEIEKFCLKPDIVFLLDVRPEVAIERIEKEGRKKELYENIEKLKRVRERYLEVAKRLDYVVVLNGEKTIEEIFEEILKILEERKII